MSKISVWIKSQFTRTTLGMWTTLRAMRLLFIIGSTLNTILHWYNYAAIPHSGSNSSFTNHLNRVEFWIETLDKIQYVHQHLSVHLLTNVKNTNYVSRVGKVWDSEIDLKPLFWPFFLQNQAVETYCWINQQVKLFLVGLTTNQHLFERKTSLILVQKWPKKLKKYTKSAVLQLLSQTSVHCPKPMSGPNYISDPIQDFKWIIRRNDLEAELEDNRKHTAQHFSRIWNFESKKEFWDMTLLLLQTETTLKTWCMLVVKIFVKFCFC